MEIDTTEDIKGKFVEKLTRSNKLIKRERAFNIAEETRITYKRRIEDAEMNLKKFKRQREALLDMSPTNSTSLEFEDFDSNTWVERHQKISMDIKKLEMALEVMVISFKDLFE